MFSTNDNELLRVEIIFFGAVGLLVALHISFIPPRLAFPRPSHLPLFPVATTPAALHLVAEVSVPLFLFLLVFVLPHFAHHFESFVTVARYCLFRVAQGAVVPTLPSRRVGFPSVFRCLFALFFASFGVWLLKKNWISFLKKEKKDL